MGATKIMSRTQALELADTIRKHNDKCCRIGGTPFTPTQVDSLLVYATQRSWGLDSAEWIERTKEAI
jgi:hypothetical protein